MTKFENSWGIYSSETAWADWKKGHFTPTCLWRWNRVFRNVGI